MDLWQNGVSADETWSIGGIRIPRQTNSPVTGRSKDSLKTIQFLVNAPGLTVLLLRDELGSCYSN